LSLPATITRDNQESTDSSKQNPCKRQSTATIIPSSAVADFILIDALSIQIVALQWPVNRRVGSPRNNGPELLAAIAA